MWFVIALFLGMFRASVRLALFKSVISSDSEILLLWLLMLWLIADSTTVIPCIGALDLHSCNVSRTIFPESLSIPLSTRTSLI